MKIILLATALLSFQTALSSDFGEAFKHAKNGNAIAQSNLGVMYENGLGVPEDHAEAVSWYRKSAEKGDVLGQSNLAFMYANGLGVPKETPPRPLAGIAEPPSKEGSTVSLA